MGKTGSTPKGHEALGPSKPRTQPRGFAMLPKYSFANFTRNKTIQTDLSQPKVNVNEVRHNWV